MDNCYLFGAGEYSPQDPFPAIIPGSLVIAVDGGYAQLTSHGVNPDLVVGDFDSLGDLPTHPNVVAHPSVKDDTDMALAVEEGIARGCRTFFLYGGLGGRLDHTLANLQLLVCMARRGLSPYLIGGGTVITALRNGALHFDASHSGTLSVFSAVDCSKGIDLQGLKYELTGAVLTGDRALGVSNEFTGRESSVSVTDGTLLVLWSGSDLRGVTRTENGK